MSDQVPPYGHESENQPRAYPGNTPYQPPSSQGRPTPPPMPGPPDQGTTGARPAELGDRFLAKLIDWVLLFVVIGFVVGFVVLGVMIGTNSGYLGTLVSSLLSTALVWGYYALMESSQGATLGKMAMKLRVVSNSGQKVTLEQTVRRNIWCGLSLLTLIPFIGFIGGLAELIAVIMIAVGISQDSVSRRAWHDKFGDTRVVKIG